MINERLTETIKDFATAKPHIIGSLVKTEWLKRHNTPPHRDVADDLSLFYRVYILFGGKRTTTIVTPDIMEKWGISEEDLFLAASANAKATTSLLSDILLGIDGMESQDDAPAIMIASNQSSFFGAADLILDPDARATLSYRLGRRRAILIPSSVHEWLALPGDADTDEIKQMINQVNNAFVDPAERLSDHPYYLMEDLTIKAA